MDKRTIFHKNKSVDHNLNCPMIEHKSRHISYKTVNCYFYIISKYKLLAFLELGNISVPEQSHVKPTI